MKKTLSLVLICSTILMSLNSCNTPATTVTKPDTAPTQNISQNIVSNNNSAYYIKNANAIHKENEYVTINVRIPEIACFGVKNDEFLDTINDKIYNDIMSLLTTCENNAKDTLYAYIQSAQKNIINNRDNQYRNLAIKYKDILTENELTLISNAIEENMLFDIQKDIYSSNSATESVVEGFTNTDGLIIDGLHNKKIIIVETTEPTTTIATTESSKDNNKRKAMANNQNTNNTTKTTNTDNTNNIENNDNDVILNYEYRPIYNVAIDNIGIDDEDTSFMQFMKDVSLPADAPITLDNFYIEFSKINSLKMPNIKDLINAYIPTEINCIYETKCMDNNYISISTIISETRTTTKETNVNYNIDIKHKKLVTLKDLLGDNYIPSCIKKISNTIKKWNDNEKAHLLKNRELNDYINENTPFYINNNYKPVIMINNYEIEIK